MENKAIKTIARGAGWVFFGTMLSKLFTYLYRMVVARLGSDLYGLLTLGIAIVSFISFFPLVGLGGGVRRYVSFYRAKEEMGKVKATITSAFKITLPLSALFAVAIFFFADWIAILMFNKPELSILLKILSITTVIFNINTIILAAIEGFKKIEFNIISKNIAEPVTKFLLTVLLLYLGYSLFGAAIAYVGGVAATFVFSIYFLQRKVFPLFKTRIVSDKSITKSVLAFSWPLMFSTFFYLLMTWTDTLMLGYFRTSSEVGIYNTAVPTAQLLTVVPFAIIGLFIPVMTELLATNKDKELKTNLKTSTKWVFFANTPILGLIVIFPREILGVFFGREYAAGSIPLIILAAGYFIYMLALTNEKMLNVINKTKVIMVNTILIALFNILLNYILIPKYGIVGGAVATAISLILYAILLLSEILYYNNVFSIRWVCMKAVISGAVAFGLTTYLMNYISPDSIFNLIILAAIFLTTYTLVTLLAKGFEREEIEILKTIERKSGINLGFARKIIKKFI